VPKVEYIYAPVSDTYAFIASNILGDVEPKKMLLIVSNPREMNIVCNNLKFFLKQNIDIVAIPEWNCGFYDISPIYPSISVSRMHSFAELISSISCIVVTTVKSIMTKVTPQNIISDGIINLKVGQRININNILSKLIDGGYSKNDTIENYGQFALHKSSLDVHSSEYGFFFRIQINEDYIESIKICNTDLSASIKTLNNISLVPSTESIINDKTISNLNNHYHSANLSICDYQTYQMIISRNPPPNIHHYMPLLYNKMDTIFDYLSECVVLHDDLFFQKIDEYQQIIDIEFEIFRMQSGSKNKIDQLFLSKEEIVLNLSNFQCFYLSKSCDQQMNRNGIAINVDTANLD